ncbi:hypothetical protein QWY79_15180 [Halomonas sabkhae]|nr:hypothetical protein [Halomonas sabkhae]
MMKKDTLYLHVGWSKTGTSAIQSQVQQQSASFADKGILYPQSLQWPDHSHHPFALSFKGSGAYQSDMTPPQALETLRQEMETSTAPSVLISSELSPFYFNNPKFKEFVEQHFERVKVIFTVRPQSELLLSLFNQLVKDPNIRYGGSLFSLAMSNIAWLNFHQNMRQWRDVVGPQNIIVIPYSKAVVDDFFAEFGVTVQHVDDDGSRTVNPSLPTRCLSVLQARGRKATDNASFARIRNEVIDLASQVPAERDRHVLFTVPEQQSLDAHFKQGNQLLADEYGLDINKIQKQHYKPVKGLPPGIKLEDFAK